jgi:hypothetical protein
MSQVKLNEAFLGFFHKTDISCSLYSFPYTPHDNIESRILYFIFSDKTIFKQHKFSIIIWTKSLPASNTYYKRLVKYLLSAYIFKIGIYFTCKMNEVIVEEKAWHCILNSILTTFFLSCQSTDVFKIVFSPRWDKLR